jgi:hypothetical protein
LVAILLNGAGCRDYQEAERDKPPIGDDFDAAFFG